MGEGAAFLRAVAESPADDAPRLAYADWVERDARPGRRERADFIRADCGLARLPCTRAGGPCPSAGGGPASPADCPNCRTAGPLRRRRLDLWAAHARAMFRDEIALGFTVSLTDERRPAGLVGTVRRGFVSALALTTRAFLDRAAALFAAHPVTEVRLADRHP